MQPSQTDQQTESTIEKFAAQCLEWQKTGASVIGICGPQGSGKSTLAKATSALITEAGLRCVVISLDDFYLTKPERAHLAQRIHPLFQTRGVPGTHDANLGIHLFSQLLTLKRPVALPRFVKATDDRADKERWTTTQAPVDLILFEGWCVGVSAQTSNAIIRPINSLEKREDQHGIWRNYVNEQLKKEYRQWFSMIDHLIYLQIPSYEFVTRWRRQQEQENAAMVDGASPMTDSELERFIAHYERLTRHAENTLPAQADAVIHISEEHTFTDIQFSA